MDASSALAQRAARLLDESCGSGQSLELQAKRLGCTDRHLRRVFEQEYHVTPVQYLQTRRLLMAKNLLTDTNLPVLEVAMAAGFGSVRRMNDLFQKHYRLSPTDLRKSAGRTQKQEIAVNLDYRPPYRWAEILKFLAARAIPGVEAVLDGCYARTVSPAGPERDALPRLVSGRPFGSKAPASGNSKRVPGPGTSAAFVPGAAAF